MEKAIFWIAAIWLFVSIFNFLYVMKQRNTPKPPSRQAIAVVTAFGPAFWFAIVVLLLFLSLMGAPEPEEKEAEPTPEH